MHPAQQVQVVGGVNAYTAKETIELCGRAGVYKAHMRIDKMFRSSTMAGMLLSFACAVSLSTSTAPWLQENAPVLIRMIGALVFSIGLVMVLTSGVDLCTGSFMFTTLSVLQRRLSIPRMLLHWFVTFWGNLLGCLFMVVFIIGYGEVFESEPYRSQAISYADKKAVTPDWHTIFLRGVGANWLVCLACFLAYMARESSSKVMAIWWPTFAFVAIDLDHVVANMFFIPLAIWLEDPKITAWYYMWKSMLPALLGNIIGGGLFVAVVLWYLHWEGQDAISIDNTFFAGDEPRSDATKGKCITGPSRSASSVHSSNRRKRSIDSRQDDMV